MATPSTNKVPLSTHEIVDTLDRLNLLELVGESPWPEVSDDDDAFPVDWAEVERDSPMSRESAIGYDDDRWSRVAEELRGRMRQGGGTPPPVIVDALAWYQPIHYFGLAWGVYIKEEAVFGLAAYLLEAVHPDRRFDQDMVAGALRLALSVIYLHEALHHRTESFAIGLEIVQHAKRYCPYHDAVYKPLRAERSPDLLEESLATAQSFRRRTEDVYARSIPRDLARASVRPLRTWIRSLPPGYNSAERFFSGGPFDDALHKLCSQVDEARRDPRRPDQEWRLAPHLYRTLFNCNTVTWVVVPVGSRPLVPWFDKEAIAGLAVSSRELVKALRKHYGYELHHGEK
jgi:hypothetical protein